MVETYQRRSALAHLGLVGRAAAGSKAGAGKNASQCFRQTKLPKNSMNHSFIFTEKVFKNIGNRN